MELQTTWIRHGLLRILLPLFLLMAWIVRYSVISLGYGCLLLAGALVPGLNTTTINGKTGYYLIIVVIWSSLALLGQVIFQITIFATGAFELDILANCSSTESTLRQIGFQKFVLNDVGNILRTTLPDVVMVIVSVTVLVLCHKLVPKRRLQPSYHKVPSRAKSKLSRTSSKILSYFGEFLVGLFLAASGITNPCLLSSVYFLSFLGIATWWACYNNLGSKYKIFRIAIMVYSGAHLILLYLYQFQFFQDLVPPMTKKARLLGLTAIIKTDCGEPSLLDSWATVTWPICISPLMILILYYVLAWETRYLIEKKKRRYKRRRRYGRNSERQVESQHQDQGRSQHSNVTLSRSLVSSGEHMSYSSMEVTSQTQQHHSSHRVHHNLSPSDIEEASGQPTQSDDDDIRPLHTDTETPQIIYSEDEEATPKEGSTNVNANRFDEVEDPTTEQRGALTSVFVFIMKQSYVATLIVMMAWSITYHSWLTFVFLLWACVIWCTPKQRTVCLSCAPLIVVYAEGLLVAQYVWSFNLKDVFPNYTVDGFPYSEIGLESYDYPCIHLAVQCLFTVMFWITLRQDVREKKMTKDLEKALSGLPLSDVEHKKLSYTSTRRRLDIVDGYDSENIQAVGKFVWHLLCKYWIFVCASLFLVMAVQEAVIYRIIYMVMFLCFVLTFQISYRFWRFVVYAFWWVVVMYSMIVLTLIYTYQFKNFPEYWQNGTGLSKEVFLDIGLKSVDTTQLFLNLLTPTSFLIVIILQIHFFQKPFLLLSDINRYRYNDLGSITLPQDDDGEEGGAGTPTPTPVRTEAPTPIPITPTTPTDDNEEGPNNLQPPPSDTKDEGESSMYQSADGESRTVREKISYYSALAWQEGYGWLDRTSTLFWRIAEVHFFKIVALTIWICNVTDVSLISVVFVFVIIICLPIKRFHVLMCHMCMIWASIIILAKMLFQLQIINQPYWETNCTVVNNLTREYPFNQTISNADYLGLKRTDDLVNYLKNYLALVIVISVWFIVKVHQAQYYNKPDMIKPPFGVIFVGITRHDADTGLWPCFKYFVNYGFYKFGLEICYVTTVITMAVRLDAYSVAYGVLLAFLLALKRKHNARVWPIYILILTILLPLQYLSCLGMPPGLCWKYPWKEELDLNLRIYLYLPSYKFPPDASKLIADFFQLAFAILQWRVFNVEKKQVPNEYFPGGDNNDIPAEKQFPTDDFLSCKESYLDYVKAAVFGYMFWATLVVVFIAGTSRISIFAMGYLVACFFFFWHDQELLLTPLPRLLRLWNTLLGYNFAVILIKCAIQLVGCVYVQLFLKDACWVVQLFSILCLKSGRYQIEERDPEEECQVEEDLDSLLYYDCICFAFLLIQIRIYKSHYFQIVVNELILSEKLSSRGAELINCRLIKQVADRKDKEREVLRKIKLKMEKIKLRQAKFHEKTTLFNSDDHYIVIRSGDYYMFQEDSDDDSEELGTIETAQEADYEEDRVDPLLPPNSLWRNRPSPNSSVFDMLEEIGLIDTAIMGGTKKALHSAKLQRQGSVCRPENPFQSGIDIRKRRSTLSEVGTIYQTKSTSSRVSERRLSLSESPTYQNIDSLNPNLEVPLHRSVSEVPQLMSIEEFPVDESASKHKEDQKAEFKESQDVFYDTQTDHCCSKVTNAFRLIYEILGGLLDYLIVYLNRISREYRIVAKILAKEKLVEKERSHMADGEFTDKYPKAKSLELNDEMYKEEEQIKQHLMNDKEHEFRKKSPRIFQLLMAFYDVLVSHSDMVCYLAMCVNHLVTGGLLSLIYPLSVFLWALLMVPRVSKIYWVTAITYTEAVVVVKYIFQYKFITLEDSTTLDGLSTDPLSLPYVIGITKQEAYARYDLLLLFCLFFHRTVLKKYGLWKDADETSQDLDKAIYASNEPTPVTSPVKEKQDMLYLEEKDEEPHAQGNNEIQIYVTEDEAFKRPSTKTVTYHVNDEDLSLFSEEQFNRRDTEGTLLSGSLDELSNGDKFECGWKLLEACWQPFKHFYRQLTDPKYNATEDVYVPMFLCDFFNFCVLVLAYYSFGPQTSNTGSVASVLAQNTVPVPFIIMLLIQFLIIIIDRAIYLRKNVFAKLIFHFVLVIFMHAWLFFILPWITHRRFVENAAAMIFYFVKCISFVFAARQVRSGYPTRILGNFLTKKYNYVNLFLFKGFLVIPFLLELRSVMDWMWTDSTLGLTSWLQMEDIYANIYVLKCWRWAEDTYPTERGLKRATWIKYGLGGLLLMLLILLIWFPLLLFSLGSAVFQANPPTKCHVQISLGYNQPLYQMNMQDQDVHRITDSNYTSLVSAYDPNSPGAAFLTSYKQEDIYVLNVRGASLSNWGISPPSRALLLNDLKDQNLKMHLDFRIDFARAAEGGLNDVIVGNNFKTELTREDRMKLVGMISAPETGWIVESSTYKDAFPRFIKVTAEGRPEKVDLLEIYPTNLTTTMKSNATDTWWELQEYTQAHFYNPKQAKNYVWHKPYLTIITFNDRVVPEALSFIASYGILGLYVSVIFVVAGFVRVYFSGYSYRIAKEELPNVDKLLKLCKDIYMARETKEFKLEEELFAKLIFLYRSSETLVTYTKHKID